MVEHADRDPSRQVSGANVRGHSSDDLPVLEGARWSAAEVTTDFRKPIARAIKKIGYQLGDTPGYVFQIFPPEYFGEGDQRRSDDE
jgi:hypothetical protein